MTTIDAIDFSIEQRIRALVMGELPCDRVTVEKMLYCIRHEINQLRRTPSWLERLLTWFLGLMPGPRVKIQEVTGEQAGTSDVFFDFAAVNKIDFGAPDETVYILHSNQVVSPVKTSLGLTIGDQYLSACPLLILPPKAHVDYDSMPSGIHVIDLNGEGQ